MKEWSVAAEEDGKNALQVLQQRLPAAPSSYLRQLFKAGKVCRAGIALKEDSPLRRGEILQLPASRRLEELLASAIPPASQVYEDRYLLAVCKPAGLAVHRSEEHQNYNLTDQVRGLYSARRDHFLVAPVNRLDAGTSGLVLFGKGRKSLGEFGRVFMERQIVKRYWALVTGELPTSGRLAATVAAKGKIKEAATDVQLLERRGPFSLLEIRLLTGRTHQIRQHLAQVDLPIVGDRRYGGAAVAGFDRLFLHAYRLEFFHPFQQATLALECPLPADLEAVLRQHNFDLSRLKATAPAGASADRHRQDDLDNRGAEEGSNPS